MSRLNGSSSSTTTTTTTQACAACKYQRRKCAPDCILAPYFPHDRQRQFLNAHKLFGVSNITKIIKNLNQPDKDEAMRTIIFQSDVRANDPVGGCYRIIRELQRQIEFHKAELDLVLHQLALCRAQQQQQQQQQTHFMLETEHHQDPVTSLSCDDLVNAAADSLDIYDPMLQYQFPQTNEEDEFVVIQDNQVQLQENVHALSIEDSSLISSPCLHLKQPFEDECDEIKPLLDINDVKFEADELVERKFVPSTQLVISS
ncbi:LOB domain-containing protein 22 [Mercurialis annua]|uniref:LOB domain-containing protein 22 n=1 Tax=Mercurialis annua TaxID=3986 RepID=UPI00215F53D6|nr:LOB domain-containing protein 22 [Mercurialis annua]